MSALRRAGVWLGLIEDDDDRAYGYDDRSYDEDYPDEEYGDATMVVRNRVAGRLAEQRVAREERAHQAALDREVRRAAAVERPTEVVMTDRGAASLRSLSRPAVGVESVPPRARTGDSGSYPVRDNLALAPEESDPEPEPAPRAIAAVVPTTVAKATVAIPDERRYQITTIHPATFSDARTIGEQFRNGVPVILNLTEMAEADAKRLVDFAAGLAFGLRGSMERVANRVFLLSPANIQVTAEDKARIAEGGFFAP